MKSLFLVGLLVAVNGLTGRAAEPGEQVVVVFNSRVRESKEVAAHYSAVRHVPAGQILGLAMPTGENMSRREYHDELEMPLLDFLETNKFLVFGGEPQSMRPSLREAKIRYAVLCYGVPLRIMEDPTLIESGATNLQPPLRKNDAAVDSELALLPWSHQDRILAGPWRNPVFGVTNAALINPTNGVLIVARLDGPDASVAMNLVDKAMAAETNGLWGRAYFDLRGFTNGEYKLGDDWLRGAAEAARRYGFATVVDERPETFSTAFPMSQIALYAGWYDGDASGPFTLPHVEFMPGAFAYHLHSYSAQTLRSTNRNWCGPLLAKGATATMGCVDEPYLGGTPDVNAFIRLWLAGFTYGEAACACQHVLSWQTTVIGDPLYAPFHADMHALHDRLVARHSPLVEWSDLRFVNLNLAAGAPSGTFLQFLETEPLTRQSCILTEKLADLYQGNGQPDKAIQALREALALHPTPQTVVRLTLDLGDQLVTAGHEVDALKLYENFQKDTRDYPGALALWQKMEEMAAKSGKTAQATRYAAEIKRLSASTGR